MRPKLVPVLLALCIANTGLCAELRRLELESEPGQAERRPLPVTLEPEPEQDEWWLPRRVAPQPADCTPSADPCDISCQLADLVPSVINSTAYSAQCQNLTWTANGTRESVVRLTVSAGSTLGPGESLTVLEDGEPLAYRNVSGELWVCGGGSSLTVQYRRAADAADRGQLAMTLVAYNLTQDTVELTEEKGALEAPEQTNWTGLPDYALNTARLWHLRLHALHINVTLESVDLDPAAGDMLVVGYGQGPFDSEPAANLLTGSFRTQQRFHIKGGEAFIYFLSSHHDKPRKPFNISYASKSDNEPTTTALPTTTTIHPPTPTGRSVELGVYVTGADPRIFLNETSGALGNLSRVLAKYTDFYRLQHHIDTGPIHAPDIRYTTWLLCDYASGWVEPDPDCFRVTWYAEALTSDGGWALYGEDLRKMFVESEAEINSDIHKAGYTYTVSLELDQVNKNWWWSFTIILAPLALVVFLLVWWLRNRSNKVKSQMEKKTLVDDMELDEEDQEKIKKSEPDDIDRQLDAATGEYEDYDPQLRGRHQRRQLQTRLRNQPPAASAAPLKSALKSPKTPAQANPAFEPDDQVFFPPDETPPPPAPAPVAASAEVTEQLRLLSELNRTALQEQEQAQAQHQEQSIELPRIQELVKPQDAGDGPARIYSINDDGTGVEVEEAHPGDNIIQLEAAASLRKTSSV